MSNDKKLDIEQQRLENWAAEQNRPRVAAFFSEVMSRGHSHPESMSPLAISPLNVGISSEGGYLLPPAVQARLFSRIFTEGEILRRVGRPVDDGKQQTVQVPMVAETSRVDGSRWGGARAYWGAESAAMTESELSFGLAEWLLNKLHCLTYLTGDLLSDSPGSAAAGIEDLMTRELIFQLERAIVEGTGAGQPIGLLNASCKIAVAKETNQTAATIWATNILKMAARLWCGGWRSAVWLVNPDCIDQLAALGTEGRWGSAAASAGTVDNFWSWEPGRSGWPRLLMWPVVPVEYCSAVGTEGDIVLCDLSQYGVVLRQRGMWSPDVRFLTDEHCFRVTMRADGQPLWTSALTPLNGSDTVSPIVTLATRD